MEKRVKKAPLEIKKSNNSKNNGAGLETIAIVLSLHPVK